jgi:hypothetical protein
MKKEIYVFEIRVETSESLMIYCIENVDGKISPLYRIHSNVQSFEKDISDLIKKYPVSEIINNVPLTDFITALSLKKGYKCSPLNDKLFDKIKLSNIKKQFSSIPTQRRRCSG